MISLNPQKKKKKETLDHFAYGHFYIEETEAQGS